MATSKLKVPKEKSPKGLTQGVSDFVSRHPLSVTLGLFVGVIGLAVTAAGLGFEVGNGVGNGIAEQREAVQRVTELEVTLERMNEERATLQKENEILKSRLPAVPKINEPQPGRPGPQGTPPPVRATQGIGCGKVSGDLLRLCVGGGSWTDASGDVRLSVDRIETTGRPDRAVLSVKDAGEDRLLQLHERQALDIKREDGKPMKLTLRRISSVENYVEIDVSELLR